MYWISKVWNLKNILQHKYYFGRTIFKTISTQIAFICKFLCVSNFNLKKYGLSLKLLVALFFINDDYNYRCIVF